jgi:hypothetical protein
VSGELSKAQKVTAAKTTEIMGQIISIDSAAGYQSMTDYVFCLVLPKILDFRIYPEGSRRCTEEFKIFRPQDYTTGSYIMKEPPYNHNKPGRTHNQYFGTITPTGNPPYNHSNGDEHDSKDKTWEHPACDEYDHRTLEWLRLESKSNQ